jgi:hypothetical protein
MRMLMKNRLFYLIFLLLVVFDFVCLQAENKSEKSDDMHNDSMKTLPKTGYIKNSAGGNRLISGTGNLPRINPIDVELNGKPTWVASVSLERGSIWTVTMDDGRVNAFKILSGSIETLVIFPEKLPSGAPPVLTVSGELPSLLKPRFYFRNFLTYPVLINETGLLAGINTQGSLFIKENKKIQSLDVKALPDSRILFDKNGQLLFLTGPTNKYSHGILGDVIEATTVTLVATDRVPRILLTISIERESVIEEISPLWADLKGNGKKEIIVTVSNQRQGSRIIVFNEKGELVAEGPAIGHGYRWRHLIAVAPFGPNGELELAVVKTPHIGGVVEYYRLFEGKLEIVAENDGYSSHRIGSRNLEMAAAGDFDGDGRVELLIPNNNFTELGGIRRTKRGSQVVWHIPVNGRISTNLSALTLKNGKMAIGVGTEDGRLRLWIPEE